MCVKGFLKRILPFFLTFAFGLLIASFFVSITPNFQKRGWSKHRQYHQRMEFDIQTLREENNLLKRQLLEQQILSSQAMGDGIGDAIPAEVPMPPMPPPTVKTVRVR